MGNKKLPGRHATEPTFFIRNFSGALSWVIMKENVLQRWDYLQLLANSKTKKRHNALVDAATKDEIRAITEIVKTV